jgi:hypothetical protein
VVPVRRQSPSIHRDVQESPLESTFPISPETNML